MKIRSAILTLFLLAAGSTVCLAQCDKKVSFSSSKTEHLDENGALKQADDETTVVEFNKTEITVSINHDGQDQKMTGTVKSYVCDWNVPFKTGKTVMMVSLKNDEGEARDFSLTIEGKDGVITLLAENKDHPDDKIKLAAVKFEEKN
ncbi:MAG TPA: hypothetical protein VFE54_01365 [Mucilaginibacter sp.]|jgi:hypothetical protein|nr:hypothetical protein [Mucilaginibacter sp.]